MILPGILSLLLCCWTQDPSGGRVTVSAASPDVAPQSIAAVQAEIGPCLLALRASFPGAPRQPFRVIVHESGAELPKSLQAMHHEGSPGFALLARHEIHLLLAETKANGRGLRPVVMHEIVHELLDQHCGRHGGRLPRWFHEGLAQVLANDTYLGASEEMIVWRAATGQLIPFSDLEAVFPSGRHMLGIAYAQSYSFVSWLQREYDIKTLVAMAAAVDDETSFDRALVAATHRPTAALQEAWREHVVHGSGAAWRSLLEQFFSISMVLTLPLLAMALIKRLRVDNAARERLRRADLDEQNQLAAAATSAISGSRGVEAAEHAESSPDHESDLRALSESIAGEVDDGPHGLAEEPRDDWSDDELGDSPFHAPDRDGPPRAD